MTDHYFTLDEANGMLPAIRPLVEKILQISHELAEKQTDLWRAVEKGSGNGGNPAASRATVEFKRLDELVRQIQETGALLKDLNSGLVDFPSLREGQQVYLCWKYNEPEIRYWHYLDAGFAGRQPI